MVSRHYRRHQNGKVLSIRLTGPIVRFRNSLRRRALRNRLGELANYLELSEQIPGWTRGAEAVALARVARSIDGDAVIVEIGVFLGSAIVILAGARQRATENLPACCRRRCQPA